MNRAARRAMARCKHEIATKTDGDGNPSLAVCRHGCGWEQPIPDDDERRQIVRNLASPVDAGLPDRRTIEMTNTSIEFATVAFNKCVMHPNTTVLWTSAGRPQMTQTFSELHRFAHEPHNERHVAKISGGHGHGRIEFINGSRMLFITRNGYAGRGIIGVNLLVLDGADRPARARIRDLVSGDAGRLEIDELAPTQFGVDNPQTWFIPSTENAE